MIKVDLLCFSILRKKWSCRSSTRPRFPRLCISSMNRPGDFRRKQGWIMSPFKTHRDIFDVWNIFSRLTYKAWTQLNWISLTWMGAQDSVESVFRIVNFYCWKMIMLSSTLPGTFFFCTAGFSWVLRTRRKDFVINIFHFNDPLLNLQGAKMTRRLLNGVFV